MRNISQSWFVLEGVLQDFLGGPRTINKKIYKSEGGLTMVDSGIPGSLELVEEELVEAGLSLKQVTYLIITYHHADHIGNLSLIHSRYPDIPVYAHRLEIPYIRGEREDAKGNVSIDELRELFPRITKSEVEELYKTKN